MFLLPLFLTSLLATPPNGPTGLTVRHDRRGRVRAVVLHEGQSPVLPNPDDALGARDQVQSFLDRHRDLFGVSPSNALVPLEIAEFVPAANAIAPGLRTRSFGRFTQSHRGIRIRGGEIKVFWLDGRLRRVSGRPWSESDLAPLGRILDSRALLSAEAVRARLAADCPTGVTFSETRATQEYDPEGEDIVRRAYCGGERWLVGMTSASVLERAPRFDYFSPHSGGVDMRGLADGDVDADSNPWIPPSSLVSGGATLQVHSGVLVDSEPRPGSPGNCDYRSTYNGNPSSFPFPAGYVNGGLYYVSGSCSSGGSAYLSSSYDNALALQVSYKSLSTAARQAAWQLHLGLFAAISPNTWNTLSFDVSYDTSDDYCDNDPNDNFTTWASYDEESHRICVDGDIGPIYQSLLHEYGHYIHYRYGVESGSDCEELATTEGLADALMLSLEHFRYWPYGSLDSSELDALARRGPGLGTRRTVSSSYGAEPRLDFPGEYVAAVEECNGQGEILYYNGMAIGQILWSLLMNRYCVSFSGDSCASVDRFTRSTLDSDVEIVVRDSFTWTMKGVVTMTPFDFLQDYLDDLLTYYSVYFTSADEARILAAFQAHSGDFEAP